MGEAEMTQKHSFPIKECVAEVQIATQVDNGVCFYGVDKEVS